MLTWLLALCKHGQFLGTIYFAFQCIYTVQYFSLMVTAMWLRQFIFTNLCLLLGLMSNGKQRWTAYGKIHLIWRVHYKQTSWQGEVFSLFEEFSANNSNNTPHRLFEHEGIKVIWEVPSRILFLLRVQVGIHKSHPSLLFLNFRAPHSSPSPASLILHLADPWLISCALFLWFPSCVQTCRASVLTLTIQNIPFVFSVAEV